MALVILPPDHRDADLSLATLIAMELELEELHVFVNVEPGAVRAVEPRLEPGPGGVTGLLAAVDGLLERIVDVLAPWNGSQPKTGKLRRLANRSTPDCKTDTTSRSLRST